MFLKCVANNAVLIIWYIGKIIFMVHLWNRPKVHKWLPRRHQWLRVQISSINQDFLALLRHMKPIEIPNKMRNKPENSKNTSYGHKTDCLCPIHEDCCHKNSIPSSCSDQEISFTSELTGFISVLLFWTNNFQTHPSPFLVWFRDFSIHHLNRCVNINLSWFRKSNLWEITTRQHIKADSFQKDDLA